MKKISEKEERRYTRQIALSEIGIDGQARLKSGSVLVIGAGGLGSPCLQYLAAAGVGRIGVVDGDKLEVSNLQRQILHRTDDVGRLKPESARDALIALNPNVDIRLFPVRLQAGNAADLLRGWDFAVDATDNFESKFLISDLCVAAGIPFSHAGIRQFFGQCMTVLPGSSACYRCVFEDVPAGEEGTPRGPLGSVPGVIGSIQATEAIKYLLGKGDLLTDRVLTFDALTMVFRTIRVTRRADCQACR